MLTAVLAIDVWRVAQRRMLLRSGELCCGIAAATGIKHLDKKGQCTSLLTVLSRAHFAREVCDSPHAIPSATFAAKGLTDRCEPWSTQTLTRYVKTSGGNSLSSRAQFSCPTT